jgi:speckle-type POZ protein
MLASSSTTVSTCTPETAQGTHYFDIFGYSQHRGIGIGNYIRSGHFNLGGHDWSIAFFPDGFEHEPDSIFIVLHFHGNGAAKVRASYDLRLVNQTTRLPSPVSCKETREFDRDNLISVAPTSIKRSDFESSIYLWDDRLTIECNIIVFKEALVSETKSFPEIEVPPSDLTEHLCKLWDEKEGMDVTFTVGGDTFGAHKIVLAMRSPVFKVEFYGPMKEATAQLVTIEDMQPAVFRALLHFIYTDTLPIMDDREGDDNTEMIRHLLVAADRYAMERLKLVCQSILCKNLNVETVATTLAMADQHNCDRLKDACIQFISCSNAMDDVVATEGYKNLKRDCPSIIVDMFEKTKKFRKT